MIRIRKKSSVGLEGFLLASSIEFEVNTGCEHEVEIELSVTNR